MGLADGHSVDVLMGECRFGEAATLLEKLRQERQDDPSLALRHGQCLHELGRLEEAAPFSIGRDARQLGPHDLALQRLHQARQLAEGNPQAERWILEALIFLLSIGSARQVGAYREGAAPTSAASAQAVPEAGERRLRIGILSADLGAHVVSGFLAAFLEGYPRDKLSVELIATRLRHEAMAGTLMAQDDGAHSTVGLSSREARELLRRQRYDVIIDTAGFTHPQNLELLAERCAPVQCHWIGYNASTGLDTIDWFLGDDVFTPAEFADQFREGIWRQPRPWLARSPRTSLPPARAEISGDAPVLGSFNQLAKLGEPTLEFWAAVLRTLPRALLVIKDRHTGNPSACQRIRGSLERRGIDPDRIRVLPALPDWQDHLRAYNGIDIALDATPWSSSSTAFDALSMGVPLVAIRGDCASARMSNSLLTGIGRQDWISADPAGFAAIVAGLARDLPGLRRGKGQRQRQVLASCLHDPDDLGAHLGDALLAMHRLAA